MTNYEEKKHYENWKSVSLNYVVFLHKILGEFSLSEVQIGRIMSKAFFRSTYKVSIFKKQLAPLVPDSFSENSCQQQAYTLWGGYCFYIQLYCRSKSILRSASKAEGRDMFCNYVGRFLFIHVPQSCLYCL